MVFGWGWWWVGVSRLGGHPPLSVGGGLGSRASFALRKGRGPLCPSDISPTSGGNPDPSLPPLPPHPGPLPRLSGVWGRGGFLSSPLPVHPWVPAFAGMTVVVQE